MSSALHPSAGQVGDILFVHHSGIRARANLSGQNLLRAVALARGKSAPARAYHVMLVIAPGVVIHAVGKGEPTRVQTLAGLVHDPKAELRCMRHRPALAPEIATVLAAEAQRFLREKYSFFYGRRSTRLGRALHAKRRHTMPFCSELVATAYAAIGITLGTRTPDLTLPVDLEQACQPPDWQDVTSEYLQVSLPPSSALDPIQVGDQTMSLAQLFEHTDQLLADGAVRQVKTVDLRFDTARQLVEQTVTLQSLSSADLNVAKMYALLPKTLFDQGSPLISDFLQSLPLFEQQLRTGVASHTASSAAQVLEQLYQDPARPPWSRIAALC